MPQNLYEALWIFMIYAFLGWCCEVAFAALNQGKFINRGFLNGPVCPIYGFGMLAVVALLWRLRENVLLLILGSALLTTALELAAGWILERFFKQKWWDYSSLPFNFKGYICLKFSVMWGIAAAFAVGAVHPFIYFLIQKTPFLIGATVLGALLLLFAADFIITLKELLKLPLRLKAMLELETALSELAEKIGGTLSDTTVSAGDFIDGRRAKAEELKAEYEKKKAEYADLIKNRSFVHRRVFKAFPNLTNGKYKTVADRIAKYKERVSERIKNEKNSL